MFLMLVLSGSVLGAGDSRREGGKAPAFVQLTFPLGRDIQETNN